MAKIALDARLWGIKHTGPGRYTQNLVENLTRLDQRNRYFLLARREDWDSIASVSPRAVTVVVEARHYSFKEQILLPLVLLKVRPDLVHVPHFNIPVFWPGRLVVTIHDLITYQFRGQEETTLPLPVYWFKYLVHRAVISLAIRKAKAIIVPSRWVKSEILKNYHLLPSKVFPVAEGVSSLFFEPAKDTRMLLAKYNLPRRYLIYTGNAYEHKNLERLLAAVKLAQTPLVIVCARSIFRDRFAEKVKEADAGDLVRFLGQVADVELRALYRDSLAFITASLSEGFGLPGLEAMAAGTLVLSSNATCLPEVYGRIPFYFDPHSTEAIAAEIARVTKLPSTERRLRIDRGVGYARKFTWAKTAKLTLKAYDYALG